MDHLVLLLARLMDFCCRDRQRKLKASAGTGGNWRPQPGFFKFMARFGRGNSQDQTISNRLFQSASTGPTVGGPEGLGGIFQPNNNKKSRYSSTDALGNLQTAQHGSPQDQAPTNPPMYGMVPSSGPTPLPPGFADPAYPSCRLASDDEEDFQGTPETEAEAEWESIQAALDVFANMIGSDFSPLPPDSATPISTPFGPAMQYRTHTIAVMWAFYYSGRIMLHRMHPSMPPAAMVAAGVAASTTAQYAQIIGKIAAGIYYPQRYNLEAGSLNPNLGAALTEVTVPLFFAGVQYTDPAQRGWTIAKLREISRLTGWQSASAIATGCETAWYHAAELGRGPPYEYTKRSAAGEGVSSKLVPHPSPKNFFMLVDMCSQACSKREHMFLAPKRPTGKCQQSSATIGDLSRLTSPYAPTGPWVS
jgi:hypothetical protein